MIPTATTFVMLGLTSKSVTRIVAIPHESLWLPSASWVSFVSFVILNTRKINTNPNENSPVQTCRYEPRVIR